MKILIVKLSSMGDIIHTLTALTAAVNAYPNLRADWVVEEAFVEIPAWHPHVERVIPIALRRWGRVPLKALCSREWRQFYRQLREQSYDYVIDAQGLIKSSWVTRLSRGQRIGLDKHSLWEPLARLAYDQHYFVDPDQHAIVRVNQLFAKSLQYPYPEQIDYGLDREKFRLPAIKASDAPYLLFLHGSSWKTKLWPQAHWLSLARRVSAANYRVLVTFGNEVERQRANQLAAACSKVQVLDQMCLTEMAGVIAGAAAVVSVDTGLGHLAAALSVPTLSLYGPTKWQAVGTLGARQYHISSPMKCERHCRRHQCDKSEGGVTDAACLSAITPTEVVSALGELDIAITESDRL